MQLPRQLRIQLETGPVRKNKAQVNLFNNQNKISMQASSPTSNPKLFKKITEGTGTVFNGPTERTSANFGFTMRNVNHLYKSNGVHM